MRDRKLVKLYQLHISMKLLVLVLADHSWLFNPTSFGTSCMAQVEPGAWRTAAGDRYRGVQLEGYRVQSRGGRDGIYSAGSKRIRLIMIASISMTRRARGRGRRMGN